MSRNSAKRTIFWKKKTHFRRSFKLDWRVSRKIGAKFKTAHQYTGDIFQLSVTRFDVNIVC